MQIAMRDERAAPTACGSLSIDGIAVAPVSTIPRDARHQLSRNPQNTVTFSKVIAL